MVWILEDSTQFAAIVRDGPTGVLGRGLKEPEQQHDSFFRIFMTEEDQKTFRGIRPCFKPPCECHECKQQFRPAREQGWWVASYRKAFTDEEARQEAARLMESMRNNLAYLSEQCDQNGNAILKRWKKMAPEQRRIFLLKVNPEMYPHQWCNPRFDYQYVLDFRKTRDSGGDCRDFTRGRARRPYRDPCLLPYLNLEALSANPLRLLGLLYNRVQYSPEQWAPFDSFLLDDQWMLGSFELTYNGQCIVMHGPNYGKLTTWRPKEAHSRSTLGFPRGILVLEAQEKLLTFLGKAVALLLDGHVRSNQTNQSSNFVDALAKGMCIKNQSSDAVQIESVYLNQPFSAPPVFDIAKLVTITQNRLNCHGDHLWLLQTDARYMRKYATNLMSDDNCIGLEKSMRYTSIALRIMHDVIKYWSWEWIMEEVLKLQDLHTKHRDVIKPGQPLPRHYANALASLEAFVREQLKRFSRSASVVLPSRPGFRDGWVFREARGLLLTSRKDDKVSMFERLFTDRLRYCLESMVCDQYLDLSDDRTPHQDYSVLFAMLDEHLEECAKDGRKDEIARLDEVLYQLFSDIAGVHQILSMVRLHRPHVPKASFDNLKEAREGKAWRYARASFLLQEIMLPCERDPVSGKFKTRDQNAEDPTERYIAEKHLGVCLEQFMTTPKPTGNRLTQARLDAEDKERETLSNFWEAMRERHRSTCRRIGINEHDLEADLTALAADSDPDYVQMMQVNRDKVLAAITAENQARTTERVDLGAAQNTWTSTSSKENHDAVFETKAKVKTRRSEVQASRVEVELPSPELHAESTSAESQIRVAVSKRSLVVFKGMFPGHDLEARSQCVQWSAFVNAMGAPGVGFVAQRGGGGSEFTFEPSADSKWFGKGSILFHRPHPGSEVDPVTLASWGKRMSKWFGWSEETFVLKK